MNYYEMKIFVYFMKKPLCIAVFESKQSLENFIASLSSEKELIKLGNIVFKKKDFSYAEISEKTAR